ncbi:hypothetical protein CMO96_02510 [Candidatus Woesebacteria bacterium]|nr:hypothetical protein [Candidatus Woesebacteria bacterium]
MKNNFFNWARGVIQEVKQNPLVYFLLLIILAGALFVRVYRLDQLLGFYYDQGRDAMVIWKLWHDGKAFFIGPVTGLPGIFLGPAYYYLMAPFYKISGGSPMLPAIFLGVLSTSAVFMLYLLGWKMHSRTAGMLASVIGAFSYSLVLSSRWLSNPTPILLTSLLLVWSMWKIATGGSKWWWVIAAFLTGISLQFESSSGVFFIPIMIIFTVWQKKRLPNLPVVFLSLGAFGATLLPQILFNFRHGNILFQNFYRVIVEEESFRTSFWEVWNSRFNLYWNVAYSKILPRHNVFAAIFLLLAGGSLLIGRKALSKNPALSILLLFITVPVLGFLLFQGNNGNVWDYYLTGFYLPFVLLFTIGLGHLWRNKMGAVIVVIFLIVFLSSHFGYLRDYLIAGVDGPNHITLGNQMQAVEWVFEDSRGRDNFNVDVYVPPVIPHAYDYLFLWQATERCGDALCGMILDQQVPLLYTLYEVDPPHPERLEAWLARQEGIGMVKESIQFGGITVERRSRISDE